MAGIALAEEGLNCKAFPNVKRSGEHPSRAAFSAERSRPQRENSGAPLKVNDGTAGRHDLSMEKREDNAEVVVSKREADVTATHEVCTLQSRGRPDITPIPISHSLRRTPIYSSLNPEVDLAMPRSGIGG
jgi:hypothetical protein